MSTLERWTMIALLAIAAPGVPAAAQSAVGGGTTAANAALVSDDEAAEEGNELNALMSILEEETELATKNRMNRDYVPGIVTVLQRDELQALGIETAWEAISLVPGIQAMRDDFGSPSLVVRGIDFPFNSGNVKVMVNSVPLSWEAAAINGSVLYLPIEQIERIEVIRGPGSVVYGDFAFMGLVNIVTRDEGSGAWLRGDSDHAYSGGARYSWGGKQPAGTESGWKGAFNVGGYTTDDAVAPNDRDGEEDRVTGTLTVGGAGFKLAAQIIDRDVELAGGAPGSPPGATTRHSETSWSVEPRYEHSISERLVAAGRLTLLGNDLETPGTTFESTLVQGAFELRADLSDTNRLLVGIEAYTAEIDATRNVPAPPTPGGPPPPTLTLVLDGADREVKSALVQDEIDLPANVRVTAGLRYDDTSDVDDRLTPRLAVVWRASERHVVKAQYAEGFRAPTFFELFRVNGTLNDLDFETVETTELNWTYNRPGSTFRLTLFHSDLEDMIFVVRGTPFFANAVEAKSEGIEGEWEHEVTRSLKLVANAAIADTEDGRELVPPGSDPAPDPAESDLLGNLALLWRPGAKSVVGARWNHVGDREAEGNDAYDQVELTYTHPDLFTDGVSLRAGVDDVLDDGAISIRPTPFGVQRLEFPGRRAWLQIEWTR